MEQGMINFNITDEMPAIIKVIGVGGGGGNAVDYMYNRGIKDVDFVICNTDSQALRKSNVPYKIDLGINLTSGLGAGNNPLKGEQAAEESIEAIKGILSSNTKMVFITAAMGGGTGTGAAPVIAREAKMMGIVTVAIVTIPARFEGPKRINQANMGIQRLKDNVDCLLVIDNEKIKNIYSQMSLSDAFAKANDVLNVAAKGIAEIITLPGYINVDFEDVRTVVTNSGVAIMGAAKASGEDRARRAIIEALESPLLNNSDILGAKNILLNITSGTDEVTMNEMSEITSQILRRVGNSAAVIWGVGTDATLGDALSITIIATGFPSNTVDFSTTKNENKTNEKLPPLIESDVAVKVDLTSQEIEELKRVPAYKRMKIRVM